jgi:hypothetical protein
MIAVRSAGASGARAASGSTLPSIAAAMTSVAVLGGVGRGAGEQVIEHRAQAEHVGALVDHLAARLLGRHVRRRAHDRAGDGERRRRR